MPEEKLVVRLGVQDGQRFKEQLRRARGETAKTAKSMKDSFKGLAGAAQAFIGGIVVREIVGAVGRLSSMAEETRLLGQSFKSLAKGIGQDSRAIHAAMKRGLDGTVSNMQMMQAANNAIMLGLPITATEMEKLSRTALRLGRAMGRGPVDALNDIVVGIGRQSRMILDNLGIIVSVEEANRRYADALGKVVSQLTDAEKKQAFYNEAIRKADDKARDLKDVSGGLTETMGKLTAAMSNLAVALGNDINPELEVMTGWLASAAQWAEKAATSMAKVSPAAAAARARHRGEADALEDYVMGMFDFSSPPSGMRLDRIRNQTLPGSNRGPGSRSSLFRALGIGTNTKGIRGSRRGYGKGTVSEAHRLAPQAGPGLGGGRESTYGDDRSMGEGGVRGTGGGLIGFDKQLKYAAIKMKEVAERVVKPSWEQIPEAMGDKFSAVLANVGAQMQALGMKGSGIFGNMAGMRAGLQGMGMKFPGMEGMTNALGQISAFGQAMQGAIGVIGGLKQGFFGTDTSLRTFGGRGLTSQEHEDIAAGTSSNEINAARSWLKYLQQAVAGETGKWGTHHTQADVDAAQSDLDRLVADAQRGGGSGSTQYAGATTITERQAGHLVGLTETMRAQDEERNAILRDIRTSNKSIANATNASAGMALMRFSGVG